MAEAEDAAEYRHRWRGGGLSAGIGWAAVTGSVDLVPLVVFAIVFFWTPPHFWSLSLFASGDYARAGVPMLPVVAGAKTTRRHIVALHAVVGAAVTDALADGIFRTGLWRISALVLGVGFIASVLRVAVDRQDAAGRQPDQ